MNVVGYIRVSTEKQAKEYGPEVQRQEIIDHCNANKYTLIHIYEDTESGAKESREDIMSLLGDARKNSFRKVIVPKIDRLSRDAMFCLWVEKELRKSNVELFSIAEPFRWDDPVQKMMLTIIAAFAEYERSSINVRMTAGRKVKAKQGGYAGGGVPLGYKAANGKLLVDREKADTVKEAFRLRGKGLSLRRIADTLNRKGHTTAQGKKFSAVQVKRILDNKEFYSGVYQYGTIEAEGLHTAIIGG